MPKRKKRSGDKRSTTRARARASGRGSKRTGPKKAGRKGKGARKAPSRSSKRKKVPGSGRKGASDHDVKGELRSRIETEVVRRKDIEDKIAKKDEEIEALEKRLNTLISKYRKDAPRKDAGPVRRTQGNDGGVEGINTSDDRKKPSGVEGSLEHRRLLELELEQERAELALLRKITELHHREKALKEREDTVKVAEEEVERLISSDGANGVISEIKENLEERLAILEIRDRRLDDIEGELDRLEEMIEGLTKKEGRTKQKGPGLVSEDEEE